LHSPLSAHETGAKLPSLTPLNWCPEKCSHLRLPVFSGALELSQLSRHGPHDWNRTSTAFRPQRSQHCASTISPRGDVGAPRRTRKLVSAAGLEPALKRLRRSPSVPTGVDKVGRHGRSRTYSRRFRRPSTGPSAWRCWSGHPESNRTATTLATWSHTMCIRVFGCSPA
jgi:hypothetical protein